MSKFTTRLPTEVNALIESLPKGSYIHGIALDKQTNDVLVLWENDLYSTGLTVPTDFSLEDIKKKKLPGGTRDTRKPVPAAAPPAPPPEPVQEAPPPKPQKNMTKKEVDGALMIGKSVEFLGIEPNWKIFDRDNDSYRDGFFYRVIEKPVDKVSI